MADRYDWERDRRRNAGNDLDERERYRDRDREWRGSGDRGDWTGSERGGWEGRSRTEDWNPDRRSEQGGLDRGSPSRNREEWGSRSSWGYGARGREEWDRDREREPEGGWRGGEDRSQWQSQRSEPWGQQRESWRNEGPREGGWREGRFGGRENWSAESNYGGRQHRGEWRDQGSDRERGRGYDWEHSGTWGSGNAGRYEAGQHEGNRWEGNRWEGNRCDRGGESSGMSSYGGGMSSAGMGAYGGGMGSYSERGRFSGRGPKGWQRSDDRIREDVNERLTRHPEIDATEIEVSVINCEVTLSGTVDDRNMRRMAEDVAENVSGVKNVQNNLRVQSQQLQLTGAGHSTPEIAGGSPQKTQGIAGTGSAQTNKKS